MLESLSFGGWARVCAAAMTMILAGIATLDTSAHANAIMEERKLPMRFTWHDRNDNDPLAKTICGQQCKGWVAAVGVVTGDTEKAFEEFSRDRNLSGATIVLDSSGGSVLDAIELGRRWRKLGVHTAVGLTFDIHSQQGERSGILAEAYCESMCAFLMLAGDKRIVPDGAHVRVHQIWLGDRVDNAKASNYSAQDLMIVQRDVGRLTKFAFEMGGTGELLDIALSVPPWEPLRELSHRELRRTNVINTEVLVAEEASSDPADFTATITVPRRTAEATPTGGLAADRK